MHAGGVIAPLGQVVVLSLNKLLILPGRTSPPVLAVAVATRLIKLAGLVVALKVQETDVLVNRMAGVIQLPIVVIGAAAVSEVMVMVAPC